MNTAKKKFGEERGIWTQRRIINTTLSNQKEKFGLPDAYCIGKLIVV